LSIGKGERKEISGFSQLLIKIFCFSPVWFIPLAAMLSLFFIFHNLDSSYIIFKFLQIPAAKLNLSMSMLLFFIRYFLFFLDVFDSLRFYALTGFIIFSCLLMLQIYIAEVYKSYLRTKVMINGAVFVHKYNVIVLCLNAGKEIINWSILFIFVVFGFVIVIYNVLTLRAFRFVPLTMYLCFPIFGFGFIRIFEFTFPRVIEFQDCATKLRALWAMDWSTGPGLHERYWRRRVRALIPIRLHGGMPGYNIFAVCKETQARYYAEIVNYTVAVLMYN